MGMVWGWYGVVWGGMGWYGVVWGCMGNTFWYGDGMGMVWGWYAVVRGGMGSCAEDTSVLT